MVETLVLDSEKYLFEMPIDSRELDNEEEYDGGFFPLVGMVESIGLGMAASICSRSNNKYVKAATVGFAVAPMVVGVVTGAGVINEAVKATTTASKVVCGARGANGLAVRPVVGSLSSAHNLSH